VEFHEGWGRGGKIPKSPHERVWIVSGTALFAHSEAFLYIVQLQKISILPS